MSNYNSLKTTIDANIKQNGRQEITGQILNSVLNQMVNILGTGYQFAGVATTATNPGSSDAKVFYIANGKGTYEKFGGIEVTEDEVVVLYYDTEWHKVATGIASNEKLTELSDEIGNYFNSDTQDWQYKRSVEIAPDSINEIIPLIGKCNCRFKVEGKNQQAFQILAKNKETGNPIVLYNSTTPVSLPVEFDNPRPDLELINVQLNGYSQATKETLKVKISKSSPIAEIKENVDNVQLDADNYKRVAKVGVVTPYFTMEDIILRIDGTSQATPNFHTSSPIRLKRGDSLVYITSATELTSMVSETKADGTFISCLEVGDIPLKERTLIATKDMYVRVCGTLTTPTINVYHLTAYRDTELHLSNVIEHSQAASGQTIRAYHIVKGHTYKVTNTSSIAGNAMNLRSRLTADGENIDSIATNLESWTKNKSILYTASADAEYIWSFINNAGSWRIEDVSSIEYRIEQLEDINVLSPKQVRFNYEIGMKDMSSIFSEFDFANKMFQEDILEQIYARFENLMQTYPNLVHKYDAVAFSNEGGTELSYPEYANGITTEGKYKVTPAYKTYLYTIMSEDSTLTSNGKRPKKKVLLIGGVHGNEKFAQYNLYAFAKLLASVNDSNFYKLIASCDFYIIPCLNGYGCYHTMRGNANYVNINRNYPVWGWTQNDPNATSRYNDLACDYTGDSAGSEFETQVVIGCVNRIKPDIVIDHHNYGEESSAQFYTEYGNTAKQNLVNQAAIDVWQKLVAEMPSYFGEGYCINARSDIESSISFTTTRWAAEQNCDAYTIEVGQSINYNDGNIITTGKEAFTANVAKIAEYTLRQQLLIYIEDVMKN